MELLVTISILTYGAYTIALLSLCAYVIGAAKRFIRTGESDMRRGPLWVLASLYYEIRPFTIWAAIPGLVIYNLWDRDAASTAIWTFNWLIAYFFHPGNDDDDRWKKRRKKVAAKVKEVGGKLIVVPIPAPSPA